MEQDREGGSLVSSDLLQESVTSQRRRWCAASIAIGLVAGGVKPKSISAIAAKDGKRWCRETISATENGCGKGHAIIERKFAYSVSHQYRCRKCQKNHKRLK